MRRDDWLGALFGVLFVWPAVLSFLAGVIVLGWQAKHWLQYAVWPTITVRDGLAWWSGQTPPEVNTGALGIDKILTWCLDGSPLTLWMMLILPIAWFLLGMGLSNPLFPDPNKKPRHR